MSKWIRTMYEPTKNTQEFKKDDKELVVPCIIGGKYVIKDVLSSGGFGAILIAESKELKNRKVLIKTILYNSLKSSFARKYDSDRNVEIKKLRENLVFECEKLLEFRRGGECRMPSIIELVKDFSPQIYGPHIDKSSNEEFVIEDLAYNEPYLVMQYIQGQTLGDYIEEGIDSILKRRNYTSYYQWERDVLEYIKDICVLMKNFHAYQKDENGAYYYIYQDLKPDNIMLTYNKFITLVDFGGLLMVAENGDNIFYSNYEGCGQPGVGTPGYMPPEMESMPEMLDVRADVYTIGATMYALLSGQDLSKLDSRHTWVRIPVEELKNKYTPRTIEIIKKATMLDKDKRYQAVFNDMEAEINKYLKKLNEKVNNL